MVTQITIPDFDFAAGAYYPQLLEALMRYKRLNVPELTEESPYEPFNQFLRMTALVGHLNNVLIDLVANESTLPTAKLVESVRNMLRLIDVELDPATPSQADVVYELAKVFAAAFEVVSEGAQVAAPADGDQAAVVFEALTPLTVQRTDKFHKVFAEESGAFTDYTTEANSPTTPADDWTPWVSAVMKDAVYFGHGEAMWNKMAVTLTVAAVDVTGTWEYYDGEYRKTAPTSATDIGGGQLEFDLTSYLGTTKQQGLAIRVQLNETTAYEDVEVTWDGSKNVATTGLLGQTVPSTDATDYTVGSEWERMDDLTDGTADFTTDGDVAYPLPQALVQDWVVGTINGVEDFWIRYRVVEVSSPTSPTVQRVRMDTGKQYVLRSVTQGQTQTDDPLGSSTGLPDQRFETSRDHFISDSDEVTVDLETWIRVENFLASLPTDKHYTIELGENDRATVVFGNGTTGRVPPLGVGNVAATYRRGADENGNVGANKIDLDKSGLTFVNKLWNPRPAAGWKTSEGSDEASLEKAKIRGPASLRAREVALGPPDVEKLTLSFKDTTGASPFSRSKAIEEGFGPKTVENVVVAAGGAQASSAQLAALDDFFNGDPAATPPIEKHLVQNQEETAVNFTPRAIDVTAVVYGDVTAQEVKNRLIQILHPEAMKEDGTTWEWDFGGEVPKSRISHEIFETDESITKVALSVPSSDVVLLARELPVPGTLNITIGS